MNPPVSGGSHRNPVARRDGGPSEIAVAERLRVGRSRRAVRQLGSGGRSDTVLHPPGTGVTAWGCSPKDLAPGTPRIRNVRPGRVRCRRHSFAHIPASVPNECPSLFPLVVSGRKQKIEVQECEGTRGHDHDLHDPPRCPIGGGRDVSAVHGRAVGCHQPDGRWSSPLRRRAMRLPGGDLALCHLSGPTARGRRRIPSPGTTRRTRHRYHQAA